MFERIVYGTGLVGAMTAGILLGSVSLSGALAQTTPAASPSAQTPQSTSATPEPAEQTEAPGTGKANDQAEQAALANQAKITADQANAAALAKFPGGTVKKTELDNESGTLAYDVRLTDSAGARQEVRVEATTGAVIATPPEAPETPGAPEAPEAAGAD